jgi:hypothetical protein
VRGVDRVRAGVHLEGEPLGGDVDALGAVRLLHDLLDDGQAGPARRRTRRRRRCTGKRACLYTHER